MADRSASIQGFAQLLRQEWPDLDAENLIDIFWLACHLSPGAEAAAPASVPAADKVTMRHSGEVVAPPLPSTSSQASPRVPVVARPDQVSTDRALSGLGANLPIQIAAANALRSRLELARALRPLMRKVASPTQKILDEAATAIQIVEQNVWSPVLVAAPERWFDLAIVVEASESLAIWAETIAELVELVEQQGAFRQIRVWRLSESGGAIALVLNGQTSVSSQSRHCDALKDPTGRRMIWLVSDCTSRLWRQSRIYEVLRDWGRSAPLVLVQLFPERLWRRTALGMGRPMRLQSVGLGATQARLAAEAVPFYPELEDEDEVDQEGRKVAASEVVTLPTISLEPEPLKRWAKIMAGCPLTSLVGMEIDLARLKLVQASDRVQVAAGSELGGALLRSVSSLSPEERVQQFCATASITAQRLAGLMAAVPVSLPVVHLIQQTLLPQSRQVHVAEVLMGGLLEHRATAPDQPPVYQFIDSVRDILIDAVPISKTLRVLDTVSAHIAERLGRGVKSFPALIVLLPELTLEQQATVQPFAELTLGTLRRLGGDYRVQADRLAQYLVQPPAKPSVQGWPPLEEFRYRTASVEVEELQRFEFETATIAQQQPQRQRSQRRKSPTQPEWVITKASGYRWQRVEDLGEGIQLELVEILGGVFQMGSPEDESQRYDDEGPQHEVKLSDFFMGKYPITQAQWRAVAHLPQVERELEPDPANFKGANRPVERVSWEDAIEFCARLSAKTGREYGLPTEAEWEYACRAGTTTPFHFGETITTDLANYRGTDDKDLKWSGSYGRGPKGIYRAKTTDVGSFPANAFGLYDMHGNVWEWCADHWHGNYVDKPEVLKENGNLPWLLDKVTEDQSEEEKARRSVRGGSWINDPRYCRSAFRLHHGPGARLNSFGFRVVCRAARILP